MASCFFTFCKVSEEQGNADLQAELATEQKRVQRILGDLAVMEGAGQLYLLNDRAVLDDLQLDPEQRRVTSKSHPSPQVSDDAHPSSGL